MIIWGLPVQRYSFYQVKYKPLPDYKKYYPRAISAHSLKPTILLIELDTAAAP